MNLLEQLKAAHGMDEMRKKRVGEFYIDRFMVEDHPEWVQIIMGACIVVRCEMVYALDCFKYQAISPQFDEISPGAFIPEYIPTIAEGKALFERKVNG